MIRKMELLIRWHLLWVPVYLAVKQSVERGDKNTVSWGIRNPSHLKINAKASHFTQKTSTGWKEIETTISVKEIVRLKRKGGKKKIK